MRKDDFFTDVPQKKVARKAAPIPAPKVQPKSQPAQDPTQTFLNQIGVTPKGQGAGVLQPGARNPVPQKPTKPVVPINRETRNKIEKAGNTKQYQESLNNPFIDQKESQQQFAKAPTQVLRIIDPVFGHQVEKDGYVRDPEQGDADNLLQTHYTHILETASSKLPFTLTDFAISMRSARPGQTNMIQTRAGGTMPMSQAIDRVAKALSVDRKEITSHSSKVTKWLQTIGAQSSRNEFDARRNQESQNEVLDADFGPVDGSVLSRANLGRTLVQDGAVRADDSDFVSAMRALLAVSPIGGSPNATLRRMTGQSSEDLTPDQRSREAFGDVAVNILPALATGGASLSGSLLSNAGKTASRVILMDAPQLGMMVHDAGGVIPALSHIGNSIKNMGSATKPEEVLDGAMGILMAFGLAHGVGSKIGRRISIAKATGFSVEALKSEAVRVAEDVKQTFDGTDRKLVNETALRLQNEALAGKASEVYSDPKIADAAASIIVHASKRDYTMHGGDTAAVRVQDKLAMSHEVPGERNYNPPTAPEAPVKSTNETPNANAGLAEEAVRQRRKNGGNMARWQDSGGVLDAPGKGSAGNPPADGKVYTYRLTSRPAGNSTTPDVPGRTIIPGTNTLSNAGIMDYGSVSYTRPLTGAEIHDFSLVPDIKGVSTPTIRKMAGATWTVDATHAENMANGNWDKATIDDIRTRLSQFDALKEKMSRGERLSDVEQSAYRKLWEGFDKGDSALIEDYRQALNAAEPKINEKIQTPQIETPPQDRATPQAKTDPVAKVSQGSEASAAQTVEVAPKANKPLSEMSTHELDAFEEAARKYEKETATPKNVLGPQYDQWKALMDANKDMEAMAMLTPSQHRALYGEEGGIYLDDIREFQDLVQGIHGTTETEAGYFLRKLRYELRKRPNDEITQQAALYVEKEMVRRGFDKQKITDAMIAADANTLRSVDDAALLNNVTPAEAAKAIERFKKGKEDKVSEGSQAVAEGATRTPAPSKAQEVAAPKDKPIETALRQTEPKDTPFVSIAELEPYRKYTVGGENYDRSISEAVHDVADAIQKGDERGIAHFSRILRLRAKEITFEQFQEQQAVVTAKHNAASAEAKAAMDAETYKKGLGDTPEAKIKKRELMRPILDEFAAQMGWTKANEPVNKAKADLDSATATRNSLRKRTKAYQEADAEVTRLMDVYEKALDKLAPLKAEIQAKAVQEYNKRAGVVEPKRAQEVAVPKAKEGGSPQQKEPWEMTAKEFADGERNAVYDALDAQPQPRETHVAVDLSRGKEYTHVNGKLNTIPAPGRVIPATPAEIRAFDNAVSEGMVQVERRVITGAGMTTAMTVKRGDKVGNVTRSRGMTPEASHKLEVQKALAEGKPVPAEVLADYPDLAGATPKGNSPDLAPKATNRELAGRGHLQDVVDRGSEAVKAEIKSLTDRINEGRKQSAELRSRASANRKLSSDWKKGGGKGMSGLEPASALLARARLNDNYVQGLIKERDLLRGTTTTLSEMEASRVKKSGMTPLPKAIKTNASKPEYAVLGDGLGAERIHPATNVDARTLNALGVDYVGIVPGENYYLAGVKDGKVVRRFDSPDVAGLKKALAEGIEPKAPLNQAPKSTKKGTYLWDEATQKGILTLNKNADASTVIHELQHHFLQTASGQTKANIASWALKQPTTPEQAEKIMAEGSKNPRYVRIQESFAYATEQSYKGKFTGPANIQEAMDAFRGYLGSVKEAFVPGEVNLNQKLEQASPQTKTPEFKKWFGESKVVDEKGEPLVVYHGIGEAKTPFDNVFRTHYDQMAEEMPAKNSGYYKSVKARADEERAFFFSSEKRTAESYDTNKNAQGVLDVYLQLKNPLVIDAQGASWNEMGGHPGEQQRRIEAKAGGHDGIIIRNTHDHSDFSKNTTDVYVAFEPTQIKSAIANSGKFDPKNPSILHHQGKKTKLTPHDSDFDKLMGEILGGEITADHSKAFAKEVGRATNIGSKKPPQEGETYADRFTHQENLTPEGAAVSNDILRTMPYTADTVAAYKERVQTLLDSGVSEGWWKKNGINTDEVGALRASVDSAANRVTEIDAKLEDKSLSPEERFSLEAEKDDLTQFENEAWHKIADQTTSAGRLLRFSQEAGIQNMDLAAIFRKAETINGGPLDAVQTKRIREVAVKGKKALDMSAEAIEARAKEALKKRRAAADKRITKAPAGVITKDIKASAKSRLQEAGILFQKGIDEISSDSMKDLSTVAVDHLIDVTQAGGDVPLGRTEFHKAMKDIFGDALSEAATEKLRMLTLKRFEHIMESGRDFGEDIWKRGNAGIESAGVEMARKALASEFNRLHQPVPFETARSIVRTFRLMSIKNRAIDVISNTANLITETLQAPLSAGFDSILFGGMRKSQGKANSAGFFGDVISSLRGGRKRWTAEIVDQMKTGDPHLLSKYGIRTEAPGVLKYVGRATGATDVVFKDITEKAVAKELDRIAPNLSPEARQMIIINEALEMTFNNENVMNTGIKAVENAIQSKSSRNIRHATGLLFDMFVPFPKVIANIVGRTGDYAFGSVKGAAKIAKGHGAKSFTIAERRTINRLFSRNLIGVGIMYAGWKLAEKGIIQPEGVSENKQYLEWATQGGDQLVGGPGKLMTAIAGLYYIQQLPSKESGQKNAPDNAVTDNQREALYRSVGIDSFISSPIMSGIKDVGGLLEGRRQFGKLVGQKVGNAVIPAGIRNTAKAMDNPEGTNPVLRMLGRTTKRKTEGFTDELKSRIPFIREDLPKK